MTGQSRYIYRIETSFTPCQSSSVAIITPSPQAVDSGALGQLLAAGCDDVSQSSLLRHTLVAAAVVAESPRRDALAGTRLAALLANCLLPQTVRSPATLPQTVRSPPFCSRRYAL